jgi:hypothetical protein
LRVTWLWLVAVGRLSAKATPQRRGATNETCRALLNLARAFLSLIFLPEEFARAFILRAQAWVCRNQAE